MSLHYLNVSVENDAACGDEPLGLRVDVTPELGRRIVELARLVTHQGLYKIEMWDHSAQWLAVNPNDAPVFPTDHNDATTDRRERNASVKEPLPLYEDPMDAVTLCVTQDRFWYEGFLHKTEICVRSEEVRIKDLGIDLGPETAVSEDNRTTATILAALRYWQREGVRSEGHEQDIATDGGRYAPLTADEIDALCERINVVNDEDPDTGPR